MSLHAIVAVFDHSKARLANRLVLLALADYAHDDGTNAFPSVDTLAGKAGVDRRTVQRALADLEAAGEIAKTGATRRGVTIWRLLLDGLRGDKLSPEGSSTRSSRRSGGNLPPQGDRTPPLDDTMPPPLDRWAAWSNANLDVANPEVLDYRLDELGIPTADRQALIAAHLTRRERRNR